MKDRILKLKSYVVTNLFEWIRGWYMPILKKQIEETSPILSLAPKVLTEEKDLKQIAPYLTLLKKALHDKDITNIAISGNYGSGKSTIIKTFQAQHPEFKFLNVSLASFYENGIPEELEKKLEVSILQQIFYHVKPTKIPDSKFRRIISLSTWKLIGLVLAIITWLYSLINIFLFNELSKFNFNTWSGNESIDWLYLTTFLFFLLGLGFLIAQVINTMINSKINKLNIKGEIEIGDKVKKSVFNEHLEEILYFFEKTDFNVLVIEDVDRFKGTQIFEKLREINTLLNNFESVKNNRKINFIYAVKDEVLSEKSNRVKFFDLIIPIIPFINQSNAEDQLLRILKENNLDDNLSIDFTNELVSFISDIDMRLLTNIILEYKIFKEKLTSDLSQDSIFAMVTYKNIFPDDFAKLYNKEGDLYDFLSQKEKYIEDLKQNLKIELEEIKAEIDQIELEKIEVLQNLRRIYHSKILEKFPLIQKVMIGKAYISIHEILKSENFLKMIEQEKSNYTSIRLQNNPYYSIENGILNFKEIENEVNKNKTFKEREKLVTAKETKILDQLKINLTKINQKINEIDNYNIAEIFNELEINQFLKGTTQHEIVKYLLINGYINENYKSYISNFHEETLTNNDFKFLNCVLSGGVLGYGHELFSIENLIKKIKPKYYKRISILNFSLLDALLTNPYFKDQKELFLDFLSLENEPQKKFILSYINRKENLNIFFKEISKCWAGLWDLIVLSKLPDKQVKELLKIIIDFVDLEDIKDFDSGVESIRNHINLSPDFLHLVKEVNDDKVLKTLKTLKIKFEVLPPLDSSIESSYSYVIKHNHYDLNLENILVLIGQKKRSNSLYTEIINSENTDLINYVDDNIEVFVETILLVNIDSIQESAVAFQRLLNHPKISLDLTQEIIEIQDGYIEELDKIEDIHVQKQLLKGLKIVPNWKNVAVYYKSLEEERFDETLIEFLNEEQVYKILANEKISDQDKKVTSSISDNIIHTIELGLDSFKSLRNSIPYWYKWFDFSKLSEGKITFSIETGLLSFDVEGFKKLSESYPKIAILLAEKYPEKFVGNFNELEVDDSLVADFLKSRNIKLEQKYELLKVIDLDQSIKDIWVAEAACDTLANSKFFSLSFEQLERMFKYNHNWESKMKLLLMHFDNLDYDEIKLLTEKLTADKYYSKLFENRKRPTFNKNELNKNLFEKLLKKGYIKSFDTNPKNVEEIRVVANY
ncbi:YobI family P-loop NTPase [Belliella pelovolcani]|uniref:YobI-like P-loop NTPase domain-containing protein n=1 Tax=Belliella pelovolcani TaxID=529505 RepID=A0A1N7PMQ4_9BACT|nr:TniB family NTP-binding protein [Belliella pelovolcani]SIT11727.1 hypothetical protein SAMN05421761_1186 [Belliella pelovolcani]